MQVHTFVNADEDIEAARVVSIVRDTLEQSADGRIAILVAARTHVDAIARELTTAGVDFQAIEIEQLRDRPVVQDLMALTRALVHVADRTAWLAVLRAPWCGLTLADLHALAGQSATTIEEAIARALASTHDDLFAAGRLSDDGRVRLSRTWPILSAALAERGRWPLRIWIERTWNALGGPATLTRVDDLDDAESYLARLEQIEIGRGPRRRGAARGAAVPTVRERAVCRRGPRRGDDDPRGERSRVRNGHRAGPAALPAQLQSRAAALGPRSRTARAAWCWRR